MPATRTTAATNTWPENVGIIGMEVYFPPTYVDQTELEQFDEVSQGKYTVGLGQDKMGFCSDCEDVNSMCLTVVQRLLEKYSISPTEIGRLEVGTETILDKSKSVKSVLMQLFTESGNTDIEGVDTINACYGGTSALFNSLNWIESSSWDGRYAMVVTGDIAVYATGNARCTGGAGAIAMLIGTDAPLIFDRGCRSTHMQHVYDFYKPNMESEYPIVDGKLSIQCYLHALDVCSQSFTEKLRAKKMISTDDLLNNAEAFIFHSPFCKLVQKSVARLLLNDFLRNPQNHPELSDYSNIKLGESYFDKDLEKALMSASQEVYQKKTKPSLLLANQVGNMYTPSVFGGLLSFLINSSETTLQGCRCVIFSYGSGMASSMYSLKVTDDPALLPSLQRLLCNLGDVKTRLNSRLKVAPKEFSDMMKLRERCHHKAPYKPTGETDCLLPGTYYLSNIDDKHRREYIRKPLSSTRQEKTTTEGQVPEKQNGFL